MVGECLAQACVAHPDAIASRLAPTGNRVCLKTMVNCGSEPARDEREALALLSVLLRLANLVPGHVQRRQKQQRQ